MKEFSVKEINELLGVNDAYKAPQKVMDVMLDDKKREEMFKRFLKVETDVSRDWFREYFQKEQAERKSKKQDFTPDSVAKLLNALISGKDKNDNIYYEPAAGTGSILVAKWQKDRIYNPVASHQSLVQLLTSPVMTYDPRAYWYQAEELSDRALPFLIFNMAIRGMNGVAIQCDSLTRKATHAYFIRNNTSDYLRFSEVIELPKTDEFAQELNVIWVDENEVNDNDII